MSCVQATVSPMMQTVIRWRRPSEFESWRYSSDANPCSNLLGNALCYIISGTLLLVVGVIITSLTFQNLDGQNGENKERYAGPVLIAGGVLVMARGALSRLWPRRRTLSARRRSLLRRYVQEIYSRPIFALENTSTFSLCDLEVSDLYHVSSRWVFPKLGRKFSTPQWNFHVEFNKKKKKQDTDEIVHFPVYHSIRDLLRGNYSALEISIALSLTH
ncbi:uncharacterized protein LOC101856424 [Aplysia californica]|uniref:Uncharacterized protein LOC101856424 n=1 Tax=Aplysia californica TaxID=6500 RepID=A0ABM0JNU4_APLCA|nr:uncharacterized protein LOC101856424 [Aplysia californica]